MAGPLAGIRIVEIGGIGPGPFAGMMLADHGAEVIRVERPDDPYADMDTSRLVLGRSRRVVTLDLKSAQGIADVRALVQASDGLIEGFRPGTMERLRLGPDALLRDNPKLVYGRMTGWGQTGPNCQYAGHDLNYISLSGAVHAIGRAGDKPAPPLALVGDFGGGGMLLAFAMAAALYHAQKTGQGQVIDCAITEGAGLLMSAFYSAFGQGRWINERGANDVDGGAPFYDVYETSDGKWISIAAIEPKFFRELVSRIGLADDASFHAPMDQESWPVMNGKLTTLFKSKSRDDWCEILRNSDACFAPVLSMAEAPFHEHAVARRSFIELSGVLQPAPAPRYSVTHLDPPRVAQPVAADEVATLR